MSQFRTRSGVVLINIKGAYMLVSTKEARKHCRYICRINSTAADLWEMIEKGSSYIEILNYFAEKYEIEDPAILKQDIHNCILQLEDMGYITEVCQEVEL